MSPRIHDRHSLVDPDGATDDELAEGLLETQREISRPIPLQQPPAGFMDRIMKRTLQILEALIAVLLLKALWTRKAFAATVVGAAAMTGVGVLTLDLAGVEAELPPVETFGEASDSPAELLKRLATLEWGGDEDGADLKVIMDPAPGVMLERANPLKRIGVATGTRHRAADLTLAGPSIKNNQGVFWASRNVDRILAQAMRRYGMSLRGKPVDEGGWRCHEGTVSEGGQLAYKYVYDGSTGLTRPVAVRCFRL